MLLLSLSDRKSLKTDAVKWLNGIEGINTTERNRVLKESFVPVGERVYVVPEKSKSDAVTTDAKDFYHCFCTKAYYGSDKPCFSFDETFGERVTRLSTGKRLKAIEKPVHGEESFAKRGVTPVMVSRIF